MMQEDSGLDRIGNNWVVPDDAAGLSEGRTAL
jgi:hypothetical protein